MAATAPLMGAAARSIEREGWRAFGWLVTLHSATIVAVALQMDLSERSDVGFMIALTVRLALPWFLLTFCASALWKLWPGPATRWLIVHRRYMGLAFAFTFAWQLVFIAQNVILGWPNSLRMFLDIGILAGVVGYIWLFAMSLTSFDAFSRRISRRAWKIGHKTGIYLLWILFVLGYGVRAFYAPIPYYVFATAALLGAGLLRLAAWGKRRRREH